MTSFENFDSDTRVHVYGETTGRAMNGHIMTYRTVDGRKESWNAQHSDICHCTAEDPFYDTEEPYEK